MNIFLLGFMGCGKSTLGEFTAGKLGILFLDLDQLIELGEGAGIPELFERNGEEWFRLKEQEYLHQSIQSEGPKVIACGGGTPCFFDNIDFINGNGISIFIDPPFSFLKARIMEDGPEKRPLINGLEEPEEYLWELWLSRRKFYSQAQHWLSGPYLQKKRFWKVIRELSGMDLATD